MTGEIWVAILGIVGTLLGYFVKRWVSGEAKKVETEKRQNVEESKSKEFELKELDDARKVAAQKKIQDDVEKNWNP